jgi:hypothetical protein
LGFDFPARRWLPNMVMGLPRRPSQRSNDGPNSVVTAVLTAVASLAVIYFLSWIFSDVMAFLTVAANILMFQNC